jgi:hypothetical protein
MAAAVTLEILAKEIRDLWHQTDETRITLGRKLLDAQHRVHAGEAGKITWERWVERNVKRSMRDVQRCIALVKGKTHKEALAALRADRDKAAAAMRQTRAKQKSQQPPANGTEQPTNVSRVPEPETVQPPCSGRRRSA